MIDTVNEAGISNHKRSLHISENLLLAQTRDDHISPKEDKIIKALVSNF